jgi:hypothetical protein
MFGGIFCAEITEKCLLKTLTKFWKGVTIKTQQEAIP